MSSDPVADFLSREQDQIADLCDEDFATKVVGQENEQDWNGFNAVPSDEQAAEFVSVDEQQEQQQSGDSYSAIRSFDTERAEPEKIRQWRIEFEAKIAEKDTAEAEAIDEWKESARHELDTWARNHEEQLVKNKAGNRESQEQFIKERDENLPGGEWERVARLCDFNPKTNKQTKDVSRMRSILFRLKTEPLIR